MSTTPATPGHAHVAQVAEQARAWTATRVGTAHAATESSGWFRADSHLLRVSLVCACDRWRVEGVVDPLAPAYDHAALPTRLRAMHRDHQTDVLLDRARAGS